MRWFQKEVAVVVWELPPSLLHVMAEQSGFGGSSMMGAYKAITAELYQN